MIYELISDDVMHSKIEEVIKVVDRKTYYVKTSFLLQIVNVKSKNGVEQRYFNERCEIEKIMYSLNCRQCSVFVM